MGYRFDTQGLSGQQKAIINKNDERVKILKEESEKKKKEEKGKE